jgi:hypothetical protein
MNTIKIAAAALALLAAAPAMAGDGRGPAPNRAPDHYASGAQAGRPFDVRSRALFGGERGDPRAATSQGFAPVDTANYGATR